MRQLLRLLFLCEILVTTSAVHEAIEIDSIFFVEEISPFSSITQAGDLLLRPLHGDFHSCQKDPKEGKMDGLTKCRTGDALRGGIPVGKGNAFLRPLCVRYLARS
jgi:hypothetical protein